MGTMQTATLPPPVQTVTDVAARTVHASKVYGSGSTAVRALDEVTVDLGSRTRIRDVVLDAGPSSYGFFSDGSASDAAPASYRLEVSRDSHTWTTVRTARGTGQLTTLKVPHDSIRYVRATLTADAAQPWTIAEVRVYR